MQKKSVKNIQKGNKNIKGSHKNHEKQCLYEKATKMPNTLKKKHQSDKNISNFYINIICANLHINVKKTKNYHNSEKNFKEWATKQQKTSKTIGEKRQKLQILEKRKN